MPNAFLDLGVHSPIHGRIWVAVVGLRVQTLQVNASLFQILKSWKITTQFNGNSPKSKPLVKFIPHYVPSSYHGPTRHSTQYTAYGVVVNVAYLRFV